MKLVVQNVNSARNMFAEFCEKVFTLYSTQRFVRQSSFWTNTKEISPNNEVRING